ncbi:MAG TPA: alcohol dehydrogenase catalytic domain-containing protein, partial [Planctomycetota bacterium]|nr:alcohol dehydrogenase catalytic domain-containing protein [Planctomycetota bacterium]
MRAVEVTAPGAFRLRTDVPVPVPGPGLVRIRVLVAGICGTDVHICRGDPSVAKMLKTPLVLGHEFCGEVDALGPGVNGFTPGTYVSAEMHEPCGSCGACLAGKRHACQRTKIHGVQLDGCFADFVVVP